MYIVSCMRTNALCLFYVFYTTRNLICHVFNEDKRTSSDGYRTITTDVSIFQAYVYQLIGFTRAKRRKGMRKH